MFSSSSLFFVWVCCLLCFCFSFLLFFFPTSFHLFCFFFIIPFFFFFSAVFFFFLNSFFFFVIIIVIFIFFSSSSSFSLFHCSRVLLHNCVLMFSQETLSFFCLLSLICFVVVGLLVGCFLFVLFLPFSSPVFFLLVLYQCCHLLCKCRSVSLQVSTCLGFFPSFSPLFVFLLLFCSCFSSFSLFPFLTSSSLLQSPSCS